MRRLVLLREALAMAMAAKVPSALIAALVAVMVAATLSTVGRTAAAEAQLGDRLDAAGSRLLTVVDVKARGLLGSSVVAQSAGLSVSERAVGTLATIDVVAGAVGVGGAKVPAWGIVGDMRSVVELVAGRWPEPGEGLVSAAGVESLGFTQPFGWVSDPARQGFELAIVGEFRSRAPFDSYAAGIVYDAGDSDAATLSVIVTDAGSAADAQQAVLGLVAATDPTALRVESPVGLAELRGQVLGDLGAFGRTLLLGVLGAGGLLVAVVVLADALVRRADLGRRRALGANRGVIVGLVTLRTLLPAVVGAAVGTGIGLWLTARLGAIPPLDFTVGVAVLATLAAVASAVPPALFAATCDPVAVLRTP